LPGSLVTSPKPFSVCAYTVQAELPGS